MKKSVFYVFGMAALCGIAPALSAQDVETVVVRSDSYYAPNARGASDANRNVNYEKYESRTTTRSYNNARGAQQTYYAPQQRQVTYTRPQQSSYSRSQMYRNYDYNNAGDARVTTTRRAETTTKQMKRKYYLAHPFFQPTEGNFGFLTDLSWNKSSYNLKFTPVETVEMSETSAEWSMEQIAIKEDFSYGITDHFSLMLMGRYDISKYKFDWPTSEDDKMDDSGLNIYGVGGQWRFVDNEKWIATLSGFYERQKDVANEFILDIRGGYKISRSTIYGVGRAWLVNFDEPTYGNGVTDSHGRSLFVAYDTDVDNAFFFEGGLGVFSVLNQDWTLNFEAMLGNYDWHNQGSVKAAIGWQPGDSFALNLYAKMTFYDSIENKKLDSYFTELNSNSEWEWKYLGKAEVDSYSEYSIGAQVIFMF